MKKANKKQNLKKLSLKKISIAKIENANKIKGGYGSLMGSFETATDLP